MNISVGYGEVDGYTLGSNTLGANLSYLVQATYAATRNALANDATSPDDAAALASLPASSPTGGNVWLSTAEAKALDLVNPTGGSTDGFVGFSNSLPFTYNDAAGVAAGTYDFFDVAVHELTETMGRLLLTGETVGGVANSYDLLDLFHYSAPGVRDYSSSTSGYFSIDGGVTDLGDFNTVAGGDAGDWAADMGYNSFDAFSYSGVVNGVTQNDLREMDILGWNGTGMSSPPPPPPPPPPSASSPTGVSITPNIAGVAGAQSASGLAANASLAKIAETGGASGDTYVYSLGGANAGSFSLSNSGNVATLSIGSGGLAGAANGRLYALSLTAINSSNGKSSPAVPFGVVVGSSNGDTINLASLTGSLGTAVPELVYGLGGSDTINGSGMTSNLWIVGGAGADAMTGGSGPNDYIYGAISDFTASAMDLITDFHTATDVIDLRGLGIHLNYAGQMSSFGGFGSTLAADSVGWQTSGGNTYVYVNTSGVSERLTAPNMKIELAGSLRLTSSDIAHL